MGLKLQHIRQLDAFPRAEEHLTQKTWVGAIVSTWGLITIALLFVYELQFYLEVYSVPEMGVDTKRGEKLPITINMTFPSLPCEVLSLDAIDMSGKHEVDLHTNIWKLRLHRDGYILGSEFVSDLVEGHATHHGHGHADGQGDHKEDKGDHKEGKGDLKDVKGDHKEDNGNHKDGIGDPGAGAGDDSKAAKDMPHKEPERFLRNVEQSVQKTVKNIRRALQDREGCQVFGVLDVERVAGNFHVSIHGMSVNVANQVFDGPSKVNVSHIIHDLSFGPKYPGIKNPLDGTVRILQEDSASFKYFIKVVPTEYRYISGRVLATNQFSVTEYDTPITSRDLNWPGVYFVYDLSPITVTITEKRRNFGHFLTRLCAVLGGTFAVTGMLDKWIHRLLESALKDLSI